MMVEPTFIVATGARTPLGLQSALAAAALRAGIVAMREHPFMVDQVGEPMPGALDPELDPGFVGPARFLALAESALREACLPLSPWTDRPIRIPLVVAFPEFRPGFTAHDAERIRLGLGQFKGLPIELTDVSVAPGGHAGGLIALATAVRRLQAGQISACLVGGVDSYFHPDTMEWLDENRQLAGSVSRSGFVPGEGAGFCLLMNERACQRLELNAIVQIRSVATGKETKLIKTEDVCLAEGLSAAVRDAVQAMHAPEERINQIICDMNGERYRGEEWGFVCLRLSQYFDDPTAYLSPADCWGDVGAASGPLFAMLVCQAVLRGYARGPRTMLWASSENGDRGVAVLEAVEGYVPGGHIQ
jgi:3-oxoacyl-(acyl-carrier-protein) synthase